MPRHRGMLTSASQADGGAAPSLLSAMWTCRDIVERPPPEGHDWSARFQRALHLALCAGCRAYLRQVEAARRVAVELHRVEAAEPEPERRATVLAAFRSRGRDPGPE